jgi:hypothetical protein
MRTVTQNESRFEQSFGGDHLHQQTSTVPAEIRQELECILASESFRGSKRCQSFLRYVVEAVHSNASDELKERTIGINIFGRSPDYDTGTDAIVRVKANEVRRRMAQYDLTADPARPVKIALKPGSYVPQIDQNKHNIPLAEAVPQTAVVKPRFTSRMLLLIAACLCAAWCTGVFLHIRAAERSPVRRFWEPMLHHAKPIICVSTPNAYRLASTAPMAIGDSKAAMYTKHALEDLRQPNRVGMAADISESDLREAPVVLIGGPRFNRWSMSMANGFRFFFGLQDNVPVVLDRSDSRRHWGLKRAAENGEVAKDYVILTRVFQSRYGPPMVSIAGLSVYGSRAGGLVLSDPVLLQHILKDAPDGWEHKNLQLVLSTNVEHKIFGGMELVASTYW